MDLLKPGDRVGVAVSAGADSVALLRLLLELRGELGIILGVVHFNHQLREGDSDADEAFVAELAREHGLELFVERQDVAAFAKQDASGIEATARKLRYHYFRSLIFQGSLNSVATAHTRDDQAETVLLRLLRGAGWRGMAAIYPRVQVVGPQEDVPGAIVRPLLRVRRNHLRNHLQSLQQPWREDATNVEERFLRNRLRSRLMPLLERDFNPAIVERLSEVAEIAREEERYSAVELQKLLQPPLWQAKPSLSAPPPGQLENEIAPVQESTLSCPVLLDLPLALQRRVLRSCLEQCGVFPAFQVVEQVRAFAQAGAGELQLPGGCRVRRTRDRLAFETPSVLPVSPADYQYSLAVPGQVRTPEAGSLIEVIEVRDGNFPAGYNPDHVYDPSLLEPVLTVRNWRAGDRYWPAHTRQPRKVKELLTARHDRGPSRKLWPVIVSGDEVVWLRGFPAPQRLQLKSHSVRALLIREQPLPSAPD
jgi:tRNA(Ile)-lysidine synthase